MAARSPKHGLTQHVRGGWYARINGKWTLVAGKREAPTAEAADAVYEERFKSLWQPSSTGPAEDVAVGPVFDVFLNAKRLMVASGELSELTLEDYEDSCQRFCDLVGKTTTVGRLVPAMFQTVRANWAQAFGPCRLSKHIVNIRSAFNWAKRNRYIADVPFYGTEFAQPDKAVFRRHREEKRQTQGAAEFSKTEITSLLNHADKQLLAAVLLGLNGGFGNTDLSNLPTTVVDLNHGWIDYARPKTGVRRRCPLWPETIEAIRTAMPLSRLAGRVFSTSDGMPLVQGKHDRLAARFKTLCEAAGCYREDRGFYGLRHSFATEAINHGPQIAVLHMMGHAADADLAMLNDHYVGGVDNALRKISNGVRAALISGWSEARAAKARAKKKGKTKGQSRHDARRKGTAQSLRA